MLSISYFGFSQSSNENKISYSEADIIKFQQSGVMVFSIKESSTSNAVRNEVHQIDNFSMLSSWFFNVDVPLGNFQSKTVTYKVMYITRPLSGNCDLGGATPSVPTPYNIGFREINSSVYIMGMIDFTKHGQDADIKKLPKVTSWLNINNVELFERK